LKNPFNDGSKKWKGLSLATTLIALSAVVLAWNITWNAPVSLVVDTVDLKVYWEPNCTTPVTTIDFGNVERAGTQYFIYMYIRNEGLGSVAMRWNSTLHLVTDKILDYWTFSYGGNINGSSITHGQVVSVRYYVSVDQHVDPGSYSWTLYLGAEQ
jgi:hypothetical protein